MRFRSSMRLAKGELCKRSTSAAILPRTASRFMIPVRGLPAALRPLQRAGRQPPHHGTPGQGTQLAAAKKFFQRHGEAELDDPPIIRGIAVIQLPTSLGCNMGLAHVAVFKQIAQHGAPVGNRPVHIVQGGAFKSRRSTISGRSGV